MGSEGHPVVLGAGRLPPKDPRNNIRDLGPEKRSAKCERYCTEPSNSQATGRRSEV